MEPKIHIRYSICIYTTLWFVKVIHNMVQLAHRTHLRKKHLAPDAGLSLDKAYSVT